MLPCTETAYVKGLDQVGLVRRELNSPDIVCFSFEDKVGSLMASCSIDREDMPWFVWSRVVVLDTVACKTGFTFTAGTKFLLRHTDQGSSAYA
jgi:hypothetical protein